AACCSWSRSPRGSRRFRMSSYSTWATLRLLWLGVALQGIQPICVRFERRLQSRHVGDGVAVIGVGFRIHLCWCRIDPGMIMVGIRFLIERVLKARDFGDSQRWNLTGRCRATYVAEFETVNAEFEAVHGLVGGLQPVFDMLDMVPPAQWLAPVRDVLVLRIGHVSVSYGSVPVITGGGRGPPPSGPCGPEPGPGP